MAHVKFLQLPPLPPHWSYMDSVEAVLGELGGAASLAQLLLPLRSASLGGAAHVSGRAWHAAARGSRY